MTVDVPAGVRDMRSRAGLFISGSHGVVEISGNDARTFLDSQLPADVSALAEDQGVYTAYLDRKGRIEQDLVLLARKDGFLALVPRPLVTPFLQKLDAYIIREDIQVTDRSEDLSVLELHGPRVPEILARLGQGPIEFDDYRHRTLEIAGTSVRVVADSWTGMVGVRLLIKAAEATSVVRSLVSTGGGDLIRLSGEVGEYLRIEGGHPEFGKDMDERTLLLELGRADMVSHNKGCYLGQETVARIHSRGQVNRLLMGIDIEGDSVPEPGTLLLLGESPVGETRSACHSPSLERVIAMAMVRRTGAEPGTVLHLRMPEGLVAATVRELPLYRSPGPRELAGDLYRAGLEAFKGDRYQEALDLFERATLMFPGLYDAHESAGVCLERLGRLDEAEEVMENLVAMAPDHVMGWTNLSRYYAQKGKIEEAEKTMGHVSFLVMKKEAGEKAAARKKREDEESSRAETVQRIELFRQVLALDPQDVVANFGLGKALLDQERFAEAAPHFRTAAANQKHYSMAYNHLATCLIRMGETGEAREVLKTGIEAATKKGDLIPKRDMTRKLSALDG